MTRARKLEDRTLSRTYRAGAHEEPPARLDAAILAAARKTVSASSTVRGPFGSHWVVPLSAAAVVALSIGLVVFLDREGAAPWRTETPPVVATTPEVGITAKHEAFLAESSVSDGLQQKEVAKVRTPESAATRSAPAARPTATELAKTPSIPAMALTPSLKGPEPRATAPAGNSLEQADRAIRRKSEGTTPTELESVAAARSPLAPSAPTAELRVGDRTIHAEVASTPEDRQRGLMFRDRLANDSGMLFVFSSDEAGAICMWMKNTAIALSVAFLDDRGRVLNIADMQPRSEVPHCATGRARFVLEVNQGIFAAAGVTAGARIGGLPGAP